MSTVPRTLIGLLNYVKNILAILSLAAIAQKLAWDDHHMKWVVGFVL